ncbi:MAG: ribulose-phosphate 3-epimerase [Ruminococcaceae bacterium]|nr:ribulose-phosphate 3-epimerase [Oscillospiraceae bacterium]
MKSLISPSLMCADFLHLGDELNKLEKNGIEYLHIDIMDGEFVPNYTLGVDFIKKLKAATKIPLDVHMMVTRPENKLDWIPFGEGDYVSVHYEASIHLHRALSMIRARGGKPMLALNPGTPLSVIEEVLPDLDAILVMTVNPGFAGQKLVPTTLDKIRRLRKYLDENGYGNVEIECDGNVSFENAKKMREAGANIFVAGTSSIYASTGSFEENIQTLREAVK